MLTLKPGLLLPSLLMLAIASPVVWVGDAPSSSVIQMAELIVGPDKASNRSSSSAQTQRERAGSYQSNAPVNSENDEVGILAPRGGAPSEERAYDNRTKARVYQQGGDALAPLPLPAVIGTDTAQTRGVENRNKARAYAGTGNGQDIDLSHVGRDGIPLVPCRDVDNVSGRIGDDSISGSIVYIVRNGQQVKVRCK